MTRPAMILVIEKSTVITIFLLSYCCYAVSQVQINDSTTVPGLFELLQRAFYNPKHFPTKLPKKENAFSRHNESIKFQSSDPKSLSPTEIEKSDSNEITNSNETSMLPHDIFPSIHETVIFQKIQYDYNSNEDLLSTTSPEISTTEYTTSVATKRRKGRKKLSNRRPLVKSKSSSTGKSIDVVTTTVVSGATPYEEFSRTNRFVRQTGSHEPNHEVNQSTITTTQNVVITKTTPTGITPTEQSTITDTEDSSSDIPEYTSDLVSNTDKNESTITNAIDDFTPQVITVNSLNPNSTDAFANYTYGSSLYSEEEDMTSNSSNSKTITDPSFKYTSEPSPSLLQSSSTYDQPTTIMKTERETTSTIQTKSSSSMITVTKPMNDSTTTDTCITEDDIDIEIYPQETYVYMNFSTDLIDIISATLNPGEFPCDHDGQGFCNFTGLVPCAEYTFTIEVDSCDKTISVNETIYTTLDIAPEILSVEITSRPERGMHVRWQPKVECSTITYIVSWNEIDGTNDSHEVIMDDLQLTFTAELFHQKYTVCVATYLNDTDSRGNSMCNDSDYSSPGQPSPPNIDETITANEIIIKYNPSNNEFVDYMEYNFNTRDSECKESNDWTKVPSTGNISIPDLAACTKYCFFIRGVNNDYDNLTLYGEIRTSELTTDTAILPPPSNFVVGFINSTFMNLTWEEINSSCSHNYKIKIKSSSNCYSQEKSLTTNKTTAPFDGLKAYTRYNISIITSTDKGTSSPNEIYKSTDTSAPNMVNFSWPSCTANNCLLSLFRPKHLTGPTTYIVSTINNGQENEDFTATAEGTDMKHECNDTALSPVLIQGLKPYSNYTIKIKVIVENMSVETNIEIQTKPSEPEQPTDVKVNCSFNDSHGQLQWQKPDEVNGVLEYFQIDFTGHRHGKEIHVNKTTIPAHDDYVYTTMLKLYPEYSYSFSIRAKTIDVSNLGPQVTKECRKDALPPAVSNENINESSITPDQTKVKIHLTANLFSDQNGDILNYSIIVYQEEAYRPNLNKILFWKDIQNSNKISPYRTTPNNWNPFRNEDREMCCDGDDESVDCEIGCNPGCAEIDGPCNGPLRSSTKYRAIVRAYTASGYGDANALSFETAESQTPHDDSSDNNTEIALGVAMPLLIIIVCTVILILYRRDDVNKLLYSIRKSRRLSSVFTTPSTEQIIIENQSSTRPIRLDEFNKHYTLMSKDSGLKFSQEFEELKAISPTFPMATAQLGENKPKNRWVNILPFDHSRVKLLPISDDITTDYINACYIPGFQSQREYIATQGPLPSTKDDFWRMAWEQSCQMIVMVTQCVERGKRKCEVYWPEDREVHYYGDLSIQLRSESILSNFTIRIFDIHFGTKSLEVKQMHFTKWPDFGCPENTSLLINFVQAVREHTPHGFVGPFIIHCSAGVGRTGTYISVDRLMQHIQHHNYVDIYGLVLEMRQFRMNMVQTEDQYVYIHSCIRDILMGQMSSGDEPLYANMALTAMGVPNHDSQL